MARKNPLSTALDKFTAKMDKSYGEGTFERSKIRPYEVISTGSITLDRALTVGGYVEGRIYEIWGQEHAGKTTLADCGLVEAQRKHPNKGTLVIDVEHRWDERWAEAHGLDLSRNLTVRPKNAEQVADQLKDALRSGLFSMIMLDSIGAMITQKKIDKDAGEATVGDRAERVTRMVQIASTLAWDTGTTVLMLNQVRAAIDSYGADITTPGGFALKHSTTGRLQVRRTGKGALYVGVGDNKEQVGHLTTVKVERHSVAMAYRSAEYALLYTPTVEFGPMGIDQALEASHVGVESGLITLAGAWYTITATGDKANGLPKLTSLIREKGLAGQIREAAIALLSGEVMDDGGITEEGDVANDEDVTDLEVEDLAQRIGADA